MAGQLRSQIYEFGDYRLDTANHSLSSNNSPIALKPKSLDLLVFLIENRERVVSKAELLENLWRDTFVEESNLTQTIYELRRALGESARMPRFIENVPKRGYRFAGQLQPASSDDLGRNDIGPHIASLAVLPFCSLHASDRDESLELGIAETLITGLSSLGRIVVRPTSSVRQLADPDLDPSEAGRNLGVDAVLHGTIQRSDSRLRVTARLIQIETGISLWSGHFDESSADIFHVQDSILERISSALSFKLSGSEVSRLRKRDTDDPEVHDLFLKCRFHWHKWTAENWRKSIEYGERVTRLDPNHAPALAWTAASYCNLGIVGVLPPRVAFEKAISLVDASLALDPEGSKANEVRAAIKLFYEWNWKDLNNALLAASEVNPNNATLMHLFAMHSIAFGAFSEAEEKMRSALRLDPLSLISNTDLGYVYFFGGRFHDAVDQFLKSLDLDPYFSHAHHGLGYSYLHQGEYEKGLASMQNGVNYRGTSTHSSPEVGYALALCGDVRGAKTIVRSLKDLAKNSYVDPYVFALVNSGLRERQETIRCLKKALENRSRELMYLRINPIFEWLRSDDDFEKIVEKIGLHSRGSSLQTT